MIYKKNHFLIDVLRFYITMVLYICTVNRSRALRALKLPEGTVGPTTRLVPTAYMILHVKYACPPAQEVPPRRRKSPRTPHITLFFNVTTRCVYTHHNSIIQFLVKCATKKFMPLNRTISALRDTVLIGS